MSDIVSSDPAIRTHTRIVDSGPGEIVVVNEQEVEDIVEFNKAHLNSHSGRIAADGEHVGKIPLNIVTRLQKAGIWNDDEALLQWLHDPDNAVWKIHPGKFV